MRGHSQSGHHSGAAAGGAERTAPAQWMPLPVANEAGAVGEGFPALLAFLGLLSSVSFLMV